MVWQEPKEPEELQSDERESENAEESPSQKAGDPALPPCAALQT